MSEAKAQGKGSAELKTTKAEKPEAVKNVADKTTKTADAAVAKKTDAAPKSASQSSISHFSSVSTPAYKEGWDSIFGNSNVDRNKKSNTDDGEQIPEKLTISDEDVDKELRAVLYKAFQRQARKQGISLAKIKKLVDLEYSLECNVRKK